MLFCFVECRGGACPGQRIIGSQHPLIQTALSLQQSFRDHVPAQGTVIFMKLQQNLIEFRLCINFSRLQRPDDLFQTDPLLFPLGGDGSQTTILKESFDDLFR